MTSLLKDTNTRTPKLISSPQDNPQYIIFNLFLPIFSNTCKYCQCCYLGLMKWRIKVGGNASSEVEENVINFPSYFLSYFKYDYTDWSCKGKEINYTVPRYCTSTPIKKILQYFYITFLLTICTTNWILNEEITPSSYDTFLVNSNKKDFQNVKLIFKVSQLNLVNCQT